DHQPAAAVPGHLVEFDRRPGADCPAVGVGLGLPGIRAGAAPVVFFLGVVTHGRLLQVNAEWRLFGEGMNRIPHYFLGLAPGMGPYLVLPATDDPWVALAAIGVQTGGNPWWQALLTAGSMIVVV